MIVEDEDPLDFIGTAGKGFSDLGPALSVASEVLRKGAFELETIDQDDVEEADDIVGGEGGKEYLPFVNSISTARVFPLPLSIPYNSLGEIGFCSPHVEHTYRKVSIIVLQLEQVGGFSGGIGGMPVMN